MTNELKTVCIISLGCPKNLVDSEHIAAKFKGCGYTLINNMAEADYILINTCAFIESARNEAIEAIMSAEEAKKNEDVKIIVTGCMAQMYGDIVREEMPFVNFVFGTGTYENIVKEIESAETPVLVGDIGDMTDIEYLNEKREFSTASYAYLKIAEGCNNCCTYCVIPSLKGKYRSRKYESIIKDARDIVAAGIKEIIIIAQDTTRYGIDLYGRRRLSELINDVSAIDGIEWIRILYAYPDEIDDEFIETIANNSKVCKYLDVPIQHISDDVLKAMRRRGDSKMIRSVVAKLRAKIPDIVLRTSLICGFPGETEENFEELRAFVSEGHFERLGAFAYSRENGTPAAEMGGQITKRVKEQRAKKIMREQKRIITANNKARIGKEYDVIVDGIADDGIFYFGRSYAEAPDIDEYIYFVSPEPLNIGDIVRVYIHDAKEYELIGEVKANEFTE